FAGAIWPLRAEVSTDGSLGARVRAATALHVPYVAVIGRREVERRELSLRERGGGEPLVLSATAAEAYLRAECSPAS
ncbi:MAG: His/Gly/Thr/Pro-type tRNA ligase C-terminal domain-containing protein, partial [Jiangellaceae bacterium]